METANKAHATDKASTPFSVLRRSGRSGFRAGFAVLACTAALAVSSCSADQPEATADQTNTAETTETAASSASPSASVKAGAAELAEPQPSPIDMDGVSASGREVLSEQGTGTGTHVVENGLEAGQVLSLSISCAPGDTVTVRRGTLSTQIPCDTPASSVLYQGADSEALPEVEVEVDLAGGSPYWLTAWVHDPQ